MRLVMLLAAYLGILTTSSTACMVGAYGDYFSFVKTVAVNNAIYSSTTNPVTLKKQAEILTRSHHQKSRYHGPHRSESTILLLMGLGMTCLALWGSRRSPTA